MKWMLKNSAGKPDGMFTFATVSFFVLTIVVFLSMFGSVSIGDFNLAIKEPNVPLLSLYFGGSFTSYVLRRNKKEDKEETGEEENV